LNIINRYNKIVEEIGDESKVSIGSVAIIKWLRNETKSDGNFDDTEKYLINAPAKAWNVDVKVD
jgi:intein-encoded DNA endonuclease-like protein